MGVGDEQVIPNKDPEGKTTGHVHLQGHRILGGTTEDVEGNHTLYLELWQRGTQEREREPWEGS